MFSMALNIPGEARLLHSQTLQVSERTWGLTQLGCKGWAT